MIIVASTRPGRVGPAVGTWFRARAEAHAGFEIAYVDLAELNLPFMDEPHHPRLRRYTQQHTKDWSARVDAADAFVFVMAEYNHGIIAPLKNAIDYLNQEWAYKPVGFVSYGGVSAGSRAAGQAKQIVGALKMMALSEYIAIPFVGQSIKDGEFRPNQVTEDSATVLLNELQRWATALATLRTPVESGT